MVKVSAPCSLAETQHTGREAGENAGWRKREAREGREEKVRDQTIAIKFNEGTVLTGRIAVLSEDWTAGRVAG